MKWLAIHVGGQKYRVDVVRRKHPELEGADGVTDHDKCRIFVASEQEEQAREDTLLHELLHAAMYVSGAYSVLEGACSGTDAHETEERMVRALTPCLHRVLKDLGFRFPKGLR